MEQNKQHRKAKSGPNAKKFTKNLEKNNPKAFAPTSGRNAEKMAKRNQELGQKRLHVPLVNREQLEAPPIVVAVVGPPKVPFVNVRLGKQHSSNLW